MSENRICEKCKCEYDVYLENCPDCGDENPEQPESVRKATMLPFKKQLLLFGIGWLGFQIIATVIELFVIIVAFESGEKVDTELLISDVYKAMITNSLAYVFVFLLLLGSTNKYLVKLLKTFLDPKAYLGGIGCLVAILVFSYLYQIVINLLNIPMSDNLNETRIEDIIKAFPTISVIVFGFLGPLCEEFTYRVGLFSATKRLNRVLAYVVTMTIFGLIHFDFTSKTMVNELLNLPTYLFGGLALSYTYEKYGFAGSATAHILNNLIAVIPVMLIR